jgi:hypothetical protein
VPRLKQYLMRGYEWDDGERCWRGWAVMRRFGGQWRRVGFIRTGPRLR